MEWRSLVKKTFSDIKKTNPSAKLSDALKKAGPIWKKMKESGEGAMKSVHEGVKKMTRRITKKGKKGKKGKSVRRKKGSKGKSGGKKSRGKKSRGKK